MTFTLDTSGVVPACGSSRPRTPYWPERRWSDLDPFTQGYVEAAFDSLRFNTHDDDLRKVGFSDLAPETLARFREDCRARYAELVPAMRRQRRNGREFYDARQAGLWPERFPPLTLYLSDEGRVCVRETSK